MPPPATPSADAIRRAHRRLRGQLVATPLIGELRLPGVEVPPTLRVKPEVLQPAGSLYFRGAMHYLLCQLGAALGLVASGEPRVVLAAATAAVLHRLPCVVVPVGEPDAAMARLLQATGAEVRPRGSAADAHDEARRIAAELGYQRMPGLEHEDYAAGIATVGVELAEELAGDSELVAVAPAALASCMALGLGAQGRTIRVEGVDPETVRCPAGLADSVRLGLRLDVGPASLAALQWTLRDGRGESPCVVLTD